LAIKPPITEQGKSGLGLEAQREAIARFAKRVPFIVAQLGPVLRPRAARSRASKPADLPAKSSGDRFSRYCLVNANQFSNSHLNL
jgi:hypothetical protein